MGNQDNPRRGAFYSGLTGFSQDDLSGSAHRTVALVRLQRAVGGYRRRKWLKTRGVCMMNNSIEPGLKLRILDPAMWTALPKSAWIRRLIVEGSAKSQAMESTYYDTPSRSLW